MDEIRFEKDFEEWLGFGYMERYQKVFPGREKLSKAFELEKSMRTVREPVIWSNEFFLFIQ